MSCNLPRCKGTPERTTCGKNQREERALPRSQNPRLRAKNGCTCAALREQSSREAIPPPNGRSFFIYFLFFFFLLRNAIAWRLRPRAHLHSYSRRLSRDPGPDGAPAFPRPRLRSGTGSGPARRPRECSSQCSARHYRNNRRRHTLIKRTHHTRDPSSHAT